MASLFAALTITLVRSRWLGGMPSAISSAVFGFLTIISCPSFSLAPARRPSPAVSAISTRERSPGFPPGQDQQDHVYYGRSREYPCTVLDVLGQQEYID